ncbi:MAG TPA: hypothetical protein VGD58_33100 [Herpetosiphonaceae bacterium]
MRSLRSITVLVILLIGLLTTYATPSTATTISRLDAAADCAAEGAHCVFLPWMRIPAPPPTLQELATIPGNIATVELSGSHAYISQDDVLYVVDVTNSRQPEVVGGHRFTGLRLPVVRDIEVRPPLAYVSTLDRFTSCCFDAQLHLLDIAQPTQPQVITSTATFGGLDIEVVDQRVYSTGFTWIYSTPDLVIHDVINASKFQARGTFGFNGSSSIAVNDSIVYVADYLNGINVLDVSDPDHIVRPAIVGTPGAAYHVAIDGAYLYVATSEVLAIFDIAAPQAPALRSVRQLPGFPTDLEVASGRAYVSLDPGGVAILDVRNPDEPELLTTYPVAGTAYAVEVDDSLIYLATSSGLQIVQVTAP